MLTIWGSGNYAKMLLQFGTYSGVGIKTSLGMGAIDIVVEKNNKDAEKKD